MGVHFGIVLFIQDGGPLWDCIVFSRWGSTLGLYCFFKMGVHFGIVLFFQDGGPLWDCIVFSRWGSMLGLAQSTR